MNVIDALWEAAGRPEPNWQGKAIEIRHAPEPRLGVCALTGDSGPVFDARHVISDQFTGWDRFRWRGADPAGLAFGATGSWVLRHRLAMQRPHVMIDGMFGEAGPAALHGALVRLPDDPTCVVAVPISGQKHVLPWCEWGRVATDDRALTWGAGDVERLGTYAALRRLGYGEAALAERVPRWAVLAKQDRDTQSWVLRHWASLDPWRADPLFMEVAARATRKPKEG